MKKRGVLSLWKAILLVIVGFVGVAGATALSLYLAGSFDEKHIEPLDMSFSQILDDGLGSYNPDYRSEEDAKKGITGRYEVSSDFKMTIISTTEGVTEDVVTLSLDGGRKVMQGQNAMITDDVITVPQTVKLNQAFTVQLNTLYNQDVFENWVVGGSSLLTATSENVVLPRKSVRIFVDVPVQEISATIHGSSQRGNVQEIVVGSAFTIDTTFLPSNSEYLFSDVDDVNKKMVVFSATAEPYIRYNENDGVFYAEQKTDGVSQLPTITAYTFANSYYQKQFMSQNENAPDLYDLLRIYFRENPTHAVSTDLQIKVLDVDVDSVEMTAQGSTLSAYVDKYFTITTSSFAGDASLGLSIKDSKNNPLPALFRNVGIKLVKGTQGLNILGGNLMKVTVNGEVTTIIQEQYNAGTDYFNAPTGTEYYLLPNTTPADYSNYFWRFSASEAQEQNFSVNFFYEDESGSWQNFFAFDNENSFSLSIIEHDYEEDPAWSNNNQIKLQINYKEDGSIDPAHIDLSNELNEINSENIYKTVKYFLFVDTNEAGYAQNINMQEVFACSNGLSYTLEIPGITGENTYKLYTLDGTVLTALKSYAGKVKVIAALIKTDADKKPYVIDGKYIIIKTSRAKEVIVESTLSISNMEPTFIVDAGITPNASGEYYIPAVNRNDSNAQKSVITFNLVLKNSEDTTSDAEKLITAYTNKKLKLVCLDKFGNESDKEYVTLQGLAQKEIQNDEITFEGSLAINEQLFVAGANNTDVGTYVKLQLQYDDGKTIHTMTVKNADNADHFYVYYQQPVSMSVEFESQNDLDFNGDGIVDEIQVNITATNGIKITWGGRQFNGTSEEIISDLNELFAVKLTDQFGKTIDLSTGIYRVKMVETPQAGNSPLINFDTTLSKITSFVSTQGSTKSTTLKLHIVDADGNAVPAFDENGNVTVDEQGNSNKLVSQELTFSISSEGVSKVLKDPYDTIKTLTDSDYVENKNKDGSLNIDTVHIEKYVSNNSEIVLNDLIKILTTDENGDETVTNNVVFKLDNNSLSNWNSDNKTDIMKMLNITTQDESQQPQYDNDAIKSIDDYKNLALKSIKVLNPFKADTQIAFVVRDENESLFNISLVITFKSDIGMSSNFENYYESHKDYLVKSGDAVTLVAGQSYDLDQYLKFTSVTGANYSWLNALKNVDLTSTLDIFTETKGVATLEKAKDTNDEITAINLKIDEVYKYELLEVTIYYGVKSSYAFSKTINFYVNPNFIVNQISNLETNPFVDLQKLNTYSLSDMYKVYKLTDFFNNGNSFNGLTVATISGASYSNQSTDKYITLTNVGKFNYVNEATLNLELGSNVLQDFMMNIEHNSQITTLDAVKVVTESADGENKIVRCDPEKHLSLQFEIGLGSDPSAVAESVL
ncbi:MAG: hypothetical protein ACI4R8_02085, partial [Candidatus Caccovivens sp.]